MRATNGSIPSAGSLSHDPEIVAVQMHWVREGNDTVNNEANRLAAAEVVDVPLGIKMIRRVTGVGKQK